MLLASLSAVAACKSPPAEPQPVAGADAATGRRLVADVGCSACHALPGVMWPKGRVGPDLDGFADQSLIAGRLPNRPDILAAYVRNAPALTPGTTMPAMPLSEEEARHVAAYLYTLSRD